MSFRILIAEDEAEIADFVMRGLREEGFFVEHAADGDAAWAALQGTAWDAVVLDWWLPGQDGFTVLQRLRQNDRNVPVLFLTARDSVADRVRGLDGGADDYLIKPFAFDELLARIRALVRRRERNPEQSLTCNDVTLDLALARASRGGKTLDLKPKEFALLAFFLRNPGRVLSRTRIYDHVWGESYDGMSNTLEVHVMELRRKLETHGPRVIQTIRGRGYYFGEPKWEAEP